jgi:lysophospholipase L1-like esterase
VSAEQTRPPAPAPRVTDYLAEQIADNPALTGRFTPSRRVPARLMAKLLAGSNVTVSVMGDSIYAGTTATTPGTDDAISLFCTHLATTYSVTVTKQNRSTGGRTTWQEWVEQGANLLADNADVYILGMSGKNDAVFEAGLAFGHRRESAIAMIESLIREIMVNRPNADIIIASGNPYNGNTIYNQTQKRFSADLARLAAAYDLPYADGWNTFPRSAPGADTALPAAMNPDGVHPNSVGYAALAAELIACIPASFDPKDARSASVRQASLPTGSVFGSFRSLGGTVTATTASNTASVDRMLQPSYTAASWTAGLTGPWTSSTAGATVWVMARATDIFFQCLTGAGQGVVDLIANGVVVRANVDLSTISAGRWLSAGQNLPPGVNHAELRVVSGSVTVQGYGYNAAPCEFIPVDSPRVTASGMGAASNVQAYYAMKSLQTAVSGTLSFEFIGTGFTIEGFRGVTALTTDVFTSIVVDGVAVPAMVWPPVDNRGASSITFPGLTGLPYGRHTVVLTFKAIGFWVGGFSILDERATERADIAEGVARAGETVVFPRRWSTPPAVTATSTTANLATVSSLSASSVAIGGTTGDVVYWRASGPPAV